MLGIWLLVWTVKYDKFTMYRKWTDYVVSYCHLFSLVLKNALAYHKILAYRIRNVLKTCLWSGWDRQGQARAAREARGRTGQAQVGRGSPEQAGTGQARLRQAAAEKARLGLTKPSQNLLEEEMLGKARDRPGQARRQEGAMRNLHMFAMSFTRVGSDIPCKSSCFSFLRNHLS